MNLATHSHYPLCVDLDGTLVSTDTLWESLFVLLRTNPWWIFLLPWWLLQGKAKFKTQIAKRVALPGEHLPYRANVLAFLQQQKAQGRQLVLVTAAHERIAQAVADYLGLFDEVIASDDQRNLRGRTKREELEKCYGEKGFDYIGDAAVDVTVFEGANRFYLVAENEAVLAKKRLVAEHVFPIDVPTLKTWIKLLRPHQWIKNSLLFLPLILAHAFLEADKLQATFLAFFAFSFAASAGYVLNDLLDLPADRAHPTKRHRPFASGVLPIQTGIPIFLFLIILSAALSFVFLPLAFLGMIILYLVVTITYSLYLKRKMIIDVLILAGLFTHRIMAGGVATDISISDWLFVFSMFFFVSLAFVKRYAELLMLQIKGKENEIKHRNYSVVDIDMLASIGPTSGYLAVLVFSLYIYSDNTQGLYASPMLLWLICPVLLYWITRIWFLAHRGQLVDDPVQFALTDKVSWAVAFLIVGLLLLAKFVALPV